MRSAAIAAAALAAACTPENGPLMSPGENCLECHGGAALPGEPATILEPEDARRWTIAGTVFPAEDAAADEGVRGAKVHVRDARGKSFTLETNQAGNFYSAEPVHFPLRVAVEHGGERHEMEPDVPYGGCNGCHRLPPRGDAPGRISVSGEDVGFATGPLMFPGESCLECHGGTLLAGEPPLVASPMAAPAWTVAGTVFATEDGGAGVEGAKVHLTDAVGATLTLTTNAAGNFYTAAPLRFPLRARIERAGRSHSMEPDVTYGGCNSCHRQPPRQDAPGRLTTPDGASDGGLDTGPLMLPGQSCLECHGGTLLAGEPPLVASPMAAPAWTVAGTVFATEDGGAGVEGALVHLTDALGATLTLATNVAGNFYTAAPLQFPLQARVEYGGLEHDMEPEIPYGGCNSCHRNPPRQEAPGFVTIPQAGGGDD